MNQPTQQFPSNPALDFANAVLAETNGGLELIEILHDIAQGIDEKATKHDRITASKILMDRGLGKCPKQAPVLSPVEGPDNGSNYNSAPHSDEPKADNESESPRLVTQIDRSLHQSLGPPPSAQTPTCHSDELGNPEDSGPFEPSSIQSSIQKHILEITDNCRTLMTVLAEIARASDDPTVKTSHRRRATCLLLDRLAGTDPTSEMSVAHHEHSPDQAQVEEEPFDKELWDEIFAELKQKEEAGIITPDPNAPQVDSPIFRFPEDFDSAPYEEEEAAKFRAEIALQVERRKKWPEFEEYRRKKLAQTYPSHSDDDGGPPDT